MLSSGAQTPSNKPHYRESHSHGGGDDAVPDDDSDGAVPKVHNKAAIIVHGSWAWNTGWRAPTPSPSSPPPLRPLHRRD